MKRHSYFSWSPKCIFVIIPLWKDLKRYLQSCMAFVFYFCFWLQKNQCYSEHSGTVWKIEIQGDEKLLPSAGFYLTSINLLYFNLCQFFTPTRTGVFHKSLSQRQSFLNILADFNSAVLWMVTISALIFSSSDLFSRFLSIVPRALNTFGTTVTIIFYSFSSLARLGYSPFFCFLLFSLCGRWTPLDCKFFSCQLILCLVLHRGFVAPFSSQSPRDFFCVSFSRIDSSLCKYRLSAWADFNLLLNFWSSRTYSYISAEVWMVSTLLYQPRLNWTRK